MIKSIQSSISALVALGRKQSLSANNVANSNSEKYKKSSGTIREGQEGTVSLSIQKVDTPGTVINESDGTLSESSNVNLAMELTVMIPTQRAYEANIKSIKTAEEMIDSVLDLKA